jgi:hypothetical protein
MGKWGLRMGSCQIPRKPKPSLTAACAAGIDRCEVRKARRSISAACRLVKVGTDGLHRGTGKSETGTRRRGLGEGRNLHLAYRSLTGSSSPGRHAQSTSENRVSIVVATSSLRLRGRSQLPDPVSRGTHDARVPRRSPGNTRPRWNTGSIAPAEA